MSWLRHSVTAQPAVEVLTLSDVKAQTRITDTSDDTSLNAYILAARKTVENRCGIKLITQTCQLTCNSWYDVGNHWLINPLQSITAVKYLDSNGVLQTLDPTVYSVIIGREPSIYLKPSQYWPSLYNAYDAVPVHPYNYTSTARDAIQITGVFGFGNAATDVPDDIKVAMLLMIAGWNENRESLGSYHLTELPQGVSALLADYQPVS